MKKGFTLLELLIVIIIIGVLAVIALTQYKNLTERARSSEAKSIIGGVRTAQKVVYEDLGHFSNLWSELGEIIATPQTGATGACLNTTNWFNYDLANTTCAGNSVTANCFIITGYRCTSGGKNPPGPSYYVRLREDNDGNQNRTTNVTSVERGW